MNYFLEKGMIQPSSSLFCSPVLLVQKKDGSYHMCVDYCALKKIIIKNRFLTPWIQDLFDFLLLRIDLKSKYHPICIVPKDIHKTAFQTTFGLYEYMVMPFGLTNAPATFNKIISSYTQRH